MAITIPRSGDRLQVPYSIVPKTNGAAYPVVSGTTRELVTPEGISNDAVVLTAVGSAPVYMVYSINSGNGTLSCLKLNKIHSIVWEFSGVVALGDKVVVSATAPTIKIGGFFRTVVKTDNVNGVGTVVALNAPATGLCVVEF